MRAIRKLNKLFLPGKFAFSAILVLAMLASFLPQTALAAATCQSYHTFRPGDTKPSISQFYGFKWKDIATANDMKANEKPSIGQVLCIPAQSTANSKKATSKSSTTSNKGVFLPVSERGAVFTVSITRHQINTTLSNFSYFHVYVVKVRDANTAFGGWYTLGKITIITLTRQSFSFEVPKELTRTTHLSVCFKDQISGVLVCRNALNL
jgi:LysM repeat protein